MIYTVTFNPALDYVLGIENLELGLVNRSSSEQILPGGKGINVSIVLNNLEMENTALGFVAGFTGDYIDSILKQYGCKTDFIIINNGMSRINVKIKSDVETEINGSGPDILKEHIADLYEKLDQLCEGDILVLAGSIPKSVNDNIYMDIMEYLQGKNIKIVVDATKKLLVNVLKYKPFLIKPNIHELGDIFEVSIKNKDEIEKYARKLKEMGAVNVLVSMAGDGAMLIDEHGELHCSQAPKGKVVNSVGAGDSMVAGFISGYLKEKTYEKAFKMGVATGSASTFSKYLATRKEVLELLERM